ncbi:Bug family tripartite tricarboxylate transporter substrate binding protein [Paracraurococcus lichenis]|uniref:Tripartite tricarboxylate transporter substrate binding protein n=1 Tax=Paracraurococcus lichenis TaxID=3064888 RepID=A0ABT9E7X8_9PROT|nr:tripartite tricarboxylate transporter substrate binding protein [Paracraurococcus sp. LOR1-02]MDO9712311.1 tripartite tricarboxylate transporter substrate binding protein [Paracraurococcus sp. LOR1-02]
MHRRTLLPALAGLPLLPRAAAAQAWTPDRPIRMLVGFAAGGSTDTTARIVAQAIIPALGQSVVVENRTGAGGNVASEAGARAAPDGYTLVMASMGTHAVNQALYRTLPFHVAKDFAAVSLVCLSHSLLVVRPSLPARSVAELVAMAKAKPGGLNAGTGGSGSSQHFSLALFEHQAGVKFTQVHYRGGAPAMADLVSGRVDLVFAPIVESVQQVRAGQVRALGITRRDRSPYFPDVPAIGEQVPGYVFSSWLGVFAPAGTPAPVVARLSEAIQAAMRVPAMRERMAELGYDAVGTTAEEFSTFQQAEITRTAELVRLSGAAVE